MLRRVSVAAALDQVEDRHQGAQQGGETPDDEAGVLPAAAELFLEGHSIPASGPSIFD